MKIVALGGLGIQGWPEFADLSNRKIVDEVIWADTNLDLLDKNSRQVDVKKIHPVKFNAKNKRRGVVWV